ncbi:aspartyl protease family protein [Sphingomonas sp.]|uniref:aspartyl protease family protein n=1 Tax=Sphingomonas sp. TaxID=28214 RepID=UPI002C2D44BC|nr:aspartyl protease family protein [Sphingomonas sp.]HWK36834.1 aspartyl protease family protein [Sphingomonas sp.]
MTGVSFTCGAAALLIAALPCAAQPAPQQAPGQIAAAPLDFEVEKGRMTVPVSVNGRGPFDFVIDTGSERSVMSRELAASLDLRPGPGARVLDFIGATAVETVHVPSLSISSLGARAIEAPALTMAHLGAPGLLGIDALQGHRVSIDFYRNRMEVRPAKRRPIGQIIVDAELRAGQLIVTQASFQGQPIAVIVDTGSLVTVGNRAMLALARNPPKLIGPISVTAVTGRRFKADLVSVNNLRIGGVRFDNVGMSFADVAPFAQFGLRDTPALILGMSSLSLFQRVEIDFANREIAFTLPRPRIDFRTTCRAYLNCTAY